MLAEVALATYTITGHLPVANQVLFSLGHCARLMHAHDSGTDYSPSCVCMHAKPSETLLWLAQDWLFTSKRLAVPIIVPENANSMPIGKCTYPNTLRLQAESVASKSRANAVLVAQHKKVRISVP